MMTTEILFKGLEGHLLAGRTANTLPDPIQGAFLADRTVAFEADCIYTGNWQDLPEDPDPALSGVWFCCSEGESFRGDFSTLCPGSRNVFLFDLPLVPLYNTVAGNITAYRRWREKFRTIEDLDTMCRVISQQIGAPVAVINSLFQRSGEGLTCPPQSGLFQMLESGQLSYQTARSILETEKGHPGKDSILLDGGGCSILEFLIRNEGKVIARVLTECSEGFLKERALPYLSDFLIQIRPRFLASIEEKALSTEAVSALAEDIIEQKVGHEEIRQRLEYVPEMLRDRPFYPAVLEFTWPIHKIPYHYISGQLEQIFPRSTVVPYHEDLLILAGARKPGFPPDYDRQRLTELLQRFEAYAGIGECSESFFSLRPMYKQAAAAARLGRVFCREPGNRIFHFLDYSHYSAVDMCVEAALRNHNLGDPIHLCHPALLTLLRYDRDNGSALFPTLRTFIECNCSATACAQEMQVHRNTINNRISQIESLTGKDFRDVYLRQQLLFSFELLEYMEKCLGMDPVKGMDRNGLDAELNIVRPFTGRI